MVLCLKMSSNEVLLMLLLLFYLSRKLSFKMFESIIH